MEGGEGWKRSISKKLESRNHAEWYCFKDLISSHNKLFESADTLKSKVTQLEIQVHQLQQDKLDAQHRIQELSASGATSGGGSSEKQAALEYKLYKLQEELTELHRQKGENAQKLMEHNNVLRLKEQEITTKDSELQEIRSKQEALETEIQSLHATIVELDTSNQMVNDEQQALQMAYTSLEEKFRLVQEENRDLVDRWMLQKAKDADKINMENEHQQRLRQEQMKRELQEAAKEPVNISTRSNSVGEMGPIAPHCTIVSVPSYPKNKFEAHDGEVYSARFSLSGKYLATGAADRRVKLWEIVNGSLMPRGVMHGSNAGIMSVQFDPQEKLILAASHDCACRVWTPFDQRLRHTLTGHGQKVMSAKFLGGATKVVSGGHDRTLKIWDLRSRACTRTIFAGSSCNDLVVNEVIGGQIISGHLDKQVRFWDTRTGSSVGEITLQGKITSLDLSADMNSVLASSRDDTIKLLDLRMNQVMSTCSADGFKVAMDHTRASFSPDGQFVICGAQDGSVFVWSASTAKLDKVLREHSSAVVVCAWQPDGSGIVSFDRGKRAIMWTNRY